MWYVVHHVCSRDMQPGIPDVSPSYMAGSRHSNLTTESVDLQQRFIDDMDLPRLRYVQSMVTHCNIGC